MLSAWILKNSDSAWAASAERGALVGAAVVVAEEVEAAEAFAVVAPLHVVSHPRALMTEKREDSVYLMCQDLYSLYRHNLSSEGCMRLASSQRIEGGGTPHVPRMRNAGQKENSGSFYQESEEPTQDTKDFLPRQQQVRTGDKIVLVEHMLHRSGYIFVAGALRY